jgi:hypothetical protein
VREFLYISKFFFVESEIVADFVQKSITNLLYDLRFSRTDSLDVLLIEENVIGGIGRKDALKGPRDPGEKPQQQTTPIGFSRGIIFYNNCKVRQPAAKWLGQALQDPIGKLLETLTLHGTIVHAVPFPVGSA